MKQNKQKRRYTLKTDVSFNESIYHFYRIAQTGFFNVSPFFETGDLPSFYVFYLVYWK